MKIDKPLKNFHMNSGFVILLSYISVVLFYMIIKNGILLDSLNVVLGVVPFLFGTIAALVVCYKQWRKPILIIGEKAVYIREFFGSYKTFVVDELVLKLGLNSLVFANDREKYIFRRTYLYRQAWDQAVPVLMSLNVRKVGK